MVKITQVKEQVTGVAPLLYKKEQLLKVIQRHQSYITYFHFQIPTGSQSPPYTTSIQRMCKVAESENRTYSLTNCLPGTGPENKTYGIATQCACTRVN